MKKMNADILNIMKIETEINKILNKNKLSKSMVLTIATAVMGNITNIPSEHRREFVEDVMLLISKHSKKWFKEAIIETGNEEKEKLT